MKSLWIRVEARKASSPDVCSMADALGMSPVHVLGHYTALGGELAEHTDDGRIADLSDATIERWAQWSGKRGEFAAAVREYMQDTEGTFDNWSETMGLLVERRAQDRRRKRQGSSTDSPRNGDGNDNDFQGNSAENGSNSEVTGRNGTLRDVTGRSADQKPFSEDSNKRSGRPAPLAVAPDLPDDAIALLARFYPKATTSDKRRRDVYGQVCRTLTVGVKVPRTNRVAFAVTADRLAAKCREVMRGHVDKPDSAIVLLLIKLADTTSLAAAEIQRAAVEHTAEEAEGRSRMSRAQEWLAANPDVQHALSCELGDAPERDATDHALERLNALTWRYTHAQRALQAWQEAGEPDPVATP